MTKEQLKEVLELLEQQDWKKAHNDCISPEYNDNLYRSVDILLQNAFNLSQYSWLEWWIWESKFGKKTHLTGTQVIGNETVAIKDFESLWKAIEYLKQP